MTEDLYNLMAGEQGPPGGMGGGIDDVAGLIPPELLEEGGQMPPLEGLSGPGDMGGMPPEMGGMPPEMGGGGSPVEMLSGLFEGVQQYLQVEPDEEDRLEATQILTRIQKLLAKNQKQEDALAGISPQGQAMRRSTQLQQGF